MGNYLTDSHKDSFEDFLSEEVCGKENFLFGQVIKCKKRKNHYGKHYTDITSIGRSADDNFRVQIYWEIYPPSAEKEVEIG